MDEPGAPLSVLLVEFVNGDHFPGNGDEGDFALFRTALGARGVPCTWLRFVIAADNPFRHGRDEVTLSETDFGALAEAASRARATAAIFSHPLYADQARALRARSPGLRSGLWRDSDPLVAGLMRRLDPGAATPVFRPDRVLDACVAVDYRWEPGNGAARAAGLGAVYLYTGSGCAYRRPVKENPCFVGVRLPDGANAFGCSFCGDPRASALPPEATRRRWVTRQLAGLGRAAGPGGAPRAVVLENVADAGLLRHALDELLRLGLRRTALLVGCRADHLLALAPRLEAILRALPARRQAVHCCTIGLESFSRDELARFNKGFEPLVALKAANLLKELEARHPGAFVYSAYKPVATILFTPWTTPAGLQGNLRLLQHLELEEEAGNLFTSRLRLHPDLAITALARRERLVLGGRGGAPRSGRRKLARPEAPWRFLDARLGPVDRLAARLEASQAMAADPLYREVQERLGADRAPRRLAAILLEAARAAETVSAPLEPAALLDEALARIEPEARRRAARSGTRRLGFELLSPAAWLERAAALLDGSKPALSLEGLSERDLASLDLRALASRGILARALGRPCERTLLLSRDRRVLSRLAELARRPDGPASRREAGALFGYPSCCRAGWARRAPDAKPPLLGGVRRAWGGDSRPGAVPARADGWALWERRLAAPGPIPGGAGPLLAPDIAFVPCRPACARARRLWEGWLRRLGLGRGDPRRVFLFHLEDPAELAACVPLGGSPREIAYDPSRVEGAPGALLDSLRAGDLLRVRPGEVEVAGRGALVRRWIAEAAVWDPRRGLDSEYWGELARAARRRADPAWRLLAERARARSRAAAVDPAARACRRPSGPAPEAAPSVLGGARGTWAAALRDVIASSLRPASRPPLRLGAWSASSVELELPSEAVVVRLRQDAGPRGPGEGLLVDVRFSGEGVACYRRVGPLALCYRDPTTLDPATVASAMEAFGAHLARLLARPPEGSR